MNGSKKANRQFHHHATSPSWKRHFIHGIDEDSVAFDWSGGVLEKKKSKATLIAKSHGMWSGDAGVVALTQVSIELGTPIKVKSMIQDGELFKPGKKLLELQGTAQAIVMVERTLINLLSYACGISTQTHAIVNRVKSAKMKSPVRITATRKTLPGYRDLAIQSTLIGGAHPHRYNLSGGVLLKENHIASAGSISKAIQQAKANAPHGLKIEIEVRNLIELKKAIQGNADIVMLDNFSPSEIKKALKLKTKSVIYEASGGISLANIDDYLIEGLDVISIGSITHSVTASDLSLLMNVLTKK